MRRHEGTDLRVRGMHEPSGLADFHEEADELALDCESDIVQGFDESGHGLGLSRHVCQD